MIDWKRRALDLVALVQEGRLIRARRLAAGLRQLEDLERMSQARFMDWWRCEDRKKSKKIYEDYLEIVRLQNKTLERLDK